MVRWEVRRRPSVSGGGRCRDSGASNVRSLSLRPLRSARLAFVSSVAIWLCGCDCGAVRGPVHGWCGCEPVNQNAMTTTHLQAIALERPCTGRSPTLSTAVLRVIALKGPIIWRSPAHPSLPLQAIALTWAFYLEISHISTLFSDRVDTLLDREDLSYTYLKRSHGKGPCV